VLNENLKQVPILGSILTHGIKVLDNIDNDAIFHFMKFISSKNCKSYLGYNSCNFDFDYDYDYDFDYGYGYSLATQLKKTFHNVNLEMSIPF
jgi:hypothetical protein